MSDMLVVLFVLRYNCLRLITKPRFYIILIVSAVYLSDITAPICEYSRLKGEPVSLWLFPLLLSNSGIVLVLFLLGVLLFCDAPFLENTEPYILIRSEKVTAALHTSGVADYAERMPEGNNTKIGRNGARLSGGEKQKLAVARALLKDSPIVILDEATSGFDVESDAYLHNIIVNQMLDKSVIMITHRYENLEGMDRIYKLDHGQIFESGA